MGGVCSGGKKKHEPLIPKPEVVETQHKHEPESKPHVHNELPKDIIEKPKTPR